MFQELESRRYLTALSIAGSPSADAVSLTVAGPAGAGVDLVVRNNGAAAITVTVDDASATLEPNRQVNTESILPGGVTAIPSIDLGGGNDALITDPNLRAPMTIIGGRGDDTLSGGGGRTMLYGGRGDDELNGGSGRDTLIGGDGSDTLSGGRRNDVYVWAGPTGDEVDTVLEYARRGADTFDFGASGGPVNADLGNADQLARQAVTGDDGATIVRVVRTLDGLAESLENVIGTPANDTLAGNAAGNYLDGQAGNDRLDGAGGPDQLIGGAGNDSLTVAARTAATGGDGDDEFYVPPDVSVAKTDLPTLSGDAGRDVQVTFAAGGNVQMLGGVEEMDVFTDTVDANGAPTTARRAQKIIGTDDDDVIRVFGHYVRDGRRKVFTSAPLFHRLEGGAGDDTLEAVFADAGVNVGDSSALRYRTILGGPGDDVLIGGETRTEDGTPTNLVGGPGNDRLVATGFDSGIASNGRSLVYANYDDKYVTEKEKLKNPTLTEVAVDIDMGRRAVTDAYGDTDTLVDVRSVTGTKNDDTIVGDANDNGIDGGLGSDAIDGGGGAHDFVNYQGRDSAVNVNLGTGGEPGSGGEPALGEADTLVSIEGTRGTKFNDTLAGSDAADIIEGGNGDDLIAGGGGDDTLYGNGGGGDDNTVAGNGGGNDTIDGGAGDDHIEGDGGTDVLTGGAGDDTFSNQDGFSQTVDGGEGFDSVQDDDVDPLTAGVQNDVISDAEFVYDAILDEDAAAPIAAARAVAALDAPAPGPQLDMMTGRLQVTGTADSDVIGVGIARGRVVVDFNGTVKRYPVADVRQIVVDAGGGRDNVTLTSDLSLPGGGAQVFGGSGNDRLTGGPGGDVLQGGAGDDAVDGGPGNDTISGGEVTPAAQDGSDGNDTLIGGEGSGDLLTYTNRTQPLTIDLTNETVTSTDDEADAVRGFENVIGGQGRDTMTGGAVNDTVRGGPGSDRLFGGSGVSRLNGERGRDFIEPTAGDYVLTGGRDGVTDQINGSVSKSNLVFIDGTGDRHVEFRGAFEDDDMFLGNGLTWSQRTRARI